MDLSTPSTSIDRIVNTGKEDWTKARNTAGQTPNPAALSQTHWTSHLRATWSYSCKFSYNSVVL